MYEMSPPMSFDHRAREDQRREPQHTASPGKRRHTSPKITVQTVPPGPMRRIRQHPGPRMAITKTRKRVHPLSLWGASAPRALGTRPLNAP